MAFTNITKQIKTILVAVLIIMFPFMKLYAAYISFQPYTVVQPNGTKVECFVSGDEWNHWIHTKDGYTVLQNINTGYYTYAIPTDINIDSNNFYSNEILNIVPSSFIVGIDSVPVSVDKWLIPQKQYKITDNYFSNKSSTNFLEDSTNQNKGELCNIVVFIKFADDNDFEKPFTYYDSIFNSKNSPSLLTYYSEVSYKQLTVQSYLATKKGTNKVLTYTANNKRGYYSPYSTVNKIGYEKKEIAKQREDSLLLEATKFISGLLPDTLNLDRNNDNKVDNIAFIINGGSDGWGDILWSHAGMVGFMHSIRGKYIKHFILLPESQLNVGALCHEFFHTLGAPDLYRYDFSSNVSPVYYWDIMENHTIVPQSICAYMKYQYGKWIDKIPTIELPGQYRLNPLTNSTNNAYIIRSNDPMEYYILEYRKPTGMFESSLKKIINAQTKNYVNFDGGLLVYKINKNFEGKGNIYSNFSVPDEIYCYRPDGNSGTNGKPWYAAFNSKVLRPEFNAKTNPKPFILNSENGGLDISDIYEQDNVLYFTTHFENITFIKQPTENENSVSLMPRISWDLLKTNRLYNLQISLEHNFATLATNEIISNDSVCHVKEKLLPDKYYYLRVGPIEKNGKVVYWSKIICFKTADKICFTQHLNNICAGSSYKLPFELNGDLPENNCFKVLLSDKTGNLNTTVEIGKIVTNKSGEIDIYIPNNLVSGYNYRIKLISTTDPNIFAIMNDVRIQGLPEAEILFTDTMACQNSISQIAFKPILTNIPDCYYKFEWKTNNCEILKMNDTNNFVEILWNNKGNAEVSLIASNIYGCSNIYTKKVYVHEKPKIVFNGPKEVCALQPINYFFTEEKFIPTTLTVNNGTYKRINRDSIQIIWKNGVRGGSIDIKRTVAGICSDSLHFHVNIKQAPEFLIVGKMNLCENDTLAYTTNLNTDPEQYNFKWEITGTGNIIGANDKQECEITGKKDSVKLSLTVTDKNTKCYLKQDTTISIFKKPEIPIINKLNDTTLICQAINASKYQWYYNNEAIYNANQNSIIPKLSGKYSVKIFNENECSAVSQPYDFMTSIYDYSETDYFISNTTNIITIMTSENINDFTYEIFNLLGTKLSEGHSNEKYLEINAKNFPKGLYCIKLKYLTKTVFHKIIIY